MHVSLGIHGILNSMHKALADHLTLRGVKNRATESARTMATGFDPATFGLLNTRKLPNTDSLDGRWENSCRHAMSKLKVWCNAVRVSCNSRDRKP